MTTWHSGASPSLSLIHWSVSVQVPLDGVFEKGGVVCVLATADGAWIGRQEQGEPRSDFFISTRPAAQQLF